MSDIPSELSYAKSHEWVRIEDDDIIIGITEHAAEALGEIVFVELPEVGQVFEASDEVAVIESVKAAADMYTPVSGEVVAINEALADAPETINEDPYGEGWFFRIKIKNDSELDNLLDASEYSEFLGTL